MGCKVGAISEHRNQHAALHAACAPTAILSSLSHPFLFAASLRSQGVVHCPAHRQEPRLHASEEVSPPPARQPQREFEINTKQINTMLNTLNTSPRGRPQPARPLPIMMQEVALRPSTRRGRGASRIRVSASRPTQSSCWPAAGNADPGAIEMRVSWWRRTSGERIETCIGWSKESSGAGRKLLNC